MIEEAGKMKGQRTLEEIKGIVENNKRIGRWMLEGLVTGEISRLWAWEKEESDRQMKRSIKEELARRAEAAQGVTR
jgi:hypothetical protein